MSNLIDSLIADMHGALTELEEIDRRIVELNQSLEKSCMTLSKYRLSTEEGQRWLIKPRTI